MTEASEILKRDYLPVVRTQIPTKTPLFNRFKKGTEDVVGSEARLSLRIGRNQGVGARANGGALPTAGQNKYKQIGLSTKNLYGRLAIEGKVFRAARNNRGAFINAAEAELKGMTEALQFDLNRQLFGDATGVLALLTSNASTTITVTSSNASSTMRWIANDMLVDIYDTTGATARGTGLTVSSADKSAGTFVVSTAATITSGDKLYRAGSKGVEITGLKAVMTADTTLYDLDRSTSALEWFNPQRMHNSGTNRPISEVLLQQAIDTADVEAGGSVSLMISAHGVRRAYQDLLTALKRYTEPKRLSGGWTALDYNGIDWVADADCKANWLYLLDESTFKIHTMIEDVFDWGEEDNQVLRQVTGYDQYEAFMVGYMELACDAPAKSVVMEDLTEK